MKKLMCLVTCLVVGSVGLLGAEVQLKELKEVEGLCVSTDFTRFVTVDADRRDDMVARVKDLKTGKVVKTIQLDREWGSPKLVSPAGKSWIALREMTPGSYNTKALVYRLSDGEAVAHLAWANNPVYSSDGRKLAYYGYPKPPADAGEWVWDMETNRHTKLRKTYSNRAYRFAFSPDGKVVATLYEVVGEYMVSLNDANTGNQVAEFKTHGDRQKYGAFVAALGFAPDGERVATASADRTVKVWDVAPKLRPQLKSRENRRGGLIGERVIPDGKQVLSLEHLDAVLALAFHPHGKWLASLSKDKKLRLWNLETGQVLAAVKLTDTPKHIGFSQEGNLIAATPYLAGVKVKVWSVEVVQSNPKDK